MIPLSTCARGIASPRPRRRQASGGLSAAAAAACCALIGAAVPAPADAQTAQVLAPQRDLAEQVARAGVPVSALAENAPPAHTVKPGDTLWSLAALFLKSPGRWPELWGMNLQDIRNPHLIYPGQVLRLVKEGGRATLELAGRAVTPQGAAAAQSEPAPPPTLRWVPRVRSEVYDAPALSSIPAALIAPFLEQIAVLSAGEFESAPRVLGGPDGRSLLGQGEVAYVATVVAQSPRVRLVRQPRPLHDPETGELLAYEARVVGSAEFLSSAETSRRAKGKGEVLTPAAYRIDAARLEVLRGDLLLSQTPAAPQAAYMPHAPSQPLQGRILGVPGEALTAGQGQVVTLNRGARDGVERGHVLPLWKASASADAAPKMREGLRLQWPEVNSGHLLVFSVSDRVAHALVMEARDPVRRGDRFGQP